jgi:hypothetical protein
LPPPCCSASAHGYPGSFGPIKRRAITRPFAIFGTGAAAARLTEPELESAWLLLRRMDLAGTPLPAQSLPADIPDAIMRDRILMALQFSGIIEMRLTDDGPVLAFQNAEARRLAQEKVRLKL